ILVAATVERHGVDGMLLATLLAGFMLAAAALLRLGSYIRLIPYPVTVGFTAGIAVLIFASQIKDLLGLSIDGGSGHDFIHTLGAATQSIATTNPFAVAVSAATIAIIALFRRWRPSIPGALVAVTLAGAAAGLFGLPVETIGARFGGIPSSLPAPAF